MAEIIRKRHRKQPENPEPSGLNYILSNPLQFIQELQALVREADEKRASVLIDALKIEHPDLYQFAESLVDQDPVLARDQLVKTFPWLGLMKLYPDHLKVIQFFQEQIKQRRGGNQYDSQNSQRQITDRS